MKGATITRLAITADSTCVLRRSLSSLPCIDLAQIKISQGFRRTNVFRVGPGNDTTVAHHVSSVCQSERHRGLLLDHENCEAALVQLPERLEDLRRRARRESE